MGIGDAFRKMGRGRIRDRCDKNRETGEVICKRTRINPDNTEIEIAGFTMNSDANCNPNLENVYENEDGALDALEKKFVPKIIGKCRNKPQDF